MPALPGATKGKKDEYANVAFGAVTLSAANTLTFSQIQMAIGMFQGIAMLIHRIAWQPTATSLREIVAATDSLHMALTSSNRLTAIYDLSDPSIIAQMQIIGIGVAVANEKLPLISDFTMLPGGGKLIAANPLYLAAVSGGFASAAVCRAQIDFTFIELADRDYMELIQAQFPANVA